MSAKRGNMIDTRVWAVSGPYGYRVGGMTREQADWHHDKLVRDMRTAGWAGVVRTIYRDGTCVHSTTV